MDHFNIDDNFFFASLGKGCIKSIDRQSTLTKGKYNLLMDIQCDNGEIVTAKTGSYIQVPIGTEHRLKAISNVKMITVGCKKQK